MNMFLLMFYIAWWVFDALVLLGSPKVRFGIFKYLIAIGLTLWAVYSHDIRVLNLVIVMMLIYTFFKCMKM